ncbi:MAG TPA: BPSS1780 family membrane protein [Pseudomonadales bacterium]|nr:BPSS1780 family membrane protein [Pseudomonadales bacterium]
MEQNPYESPNADLVTASGELGRLVEPKHCPASAGASWLGEGFSLFKNNVGMWLAITLVYGVIYFVFSMIPRVGYFWWILSVVFIGGWQFAAREADIGEGPEIEHLFAGFKKSLASLLVLGVLTAVGYLLALIIAAVLALAVTGSAGMLNAGMFDAQQFDPSTLLVLLPAMLAFFAIMLVLSVPIIMCQLFAAPLIVFHDVPVVEAMKMSFAACSRNLWSLTVWGLLSILIWLAGAFSLLLGLLVAFPVLTISTYAAYKQIFLENELSA